MERLLREYGRSYGGPVRLELQTENQIKHKQASHYGLRLAIAVGEKESNRDGDQNPTR